MTGVVPTPGTEYHAGLPEVAEGTGKAGGRWFGKDNYCCCGSCCCRLYLFDMNRCEPGFFLAAGVPISERSLGITNTAALPLHGRESDAFLWLIVRRQSSAGRSQPSDCQLSGGSADSGRRMPPASRQCQHHHGRAPASPYSALPESYSSPTNGL